VNRQIGVEKLLRVVLGDLLCTDRYRSNPISLQHYLSIWTVNRLVGPLQHGKSATKLGRS